MEIIYFFATHKFMFLALITFISLCVGSLLNVVIYRLPIMMQHQWRSECLEFLELPQQQVTKPFNLFFPRSHCPHCQHTVTTWENIPLLSYLLLKGKCAHCHHPISIRYPSIEILTTLISIIIAWHYGFSLETGFALLLSWGLISIMVIDIDHQIIPDHITLPLLWLGLLINLNGMFTTIDDAIIGTVAGYLSLWSFTQLFKLITGKIGMGHGDFKLFALFGAWLGWQVLPFIIIFASFVGAFVGIVLMILKHHHRDTPIPFGPYLATAGWIAFLWGQDIINLYLSFLNH